MAEAGQTWSYRDRKARKRLFRNLWVQRINAGCRALDMTYSRLVEGLKAAGVTLDRKVLSDLAIHDEAGFANVVARAKEALAQKATK